MADTVRTSVDQAQKLAMAREKTQGGDFEGAHLLYEEIIDSDPANVDALSENGLLYLQRGEHESAMAWIESARAINDSEKLRLVAGECFLHLGLTEDAIEVLNPVIESSPLNIQARVLTGTALAQLEDGDDALLHAQVVLQIEPEHADAKAVKAISMCQLGLINDSLDLWKSKTETTDVMAEFLLFLFAQALYEQNRLDDCLSQIDSLLKINSKHIEGLMLKSNALEDLGKVDESDAILEVVATLTADMPDEIAP